MKMTHSIKTKPGSSLELDV